jgi:hypothetical protein
MVLNWFSSWKMKVYTDAIMSHSFSLSHFFHFHKNLLYLVFHVLNQVDFKFNNLWMGYCFHFAIYFHISFFLSCFYVFIPLIIDQVYEMLYKLLLYWPKSKWWDLHCWVECLQCNDYSTFCFLYPAYIRYH